VLPKQLGRLRCRPCRWLLTERAALPRRRMTGIPLMSDTSYQIFHDRHAYKVRITCLGHFIQEAEGLSSHADATSWVAQAVRLAVIKGQREPIAPPYLRVI
jgi:hypothetical protein